jgi:RNase P subunit RPR2
MIKSKKNIVGYSLVLAASFIIVIGLAKYLTSPRPFIGYLHDEVSTSLSLPKNDDYYYWYNGTDVPELVLNKSLDISFNVYHNESINFYLMSSEQFEEWNNGLEAQSLVTKYQTSKENLYFVPPSNDTYYIVLDNTDSNVTKGLSFYMCAKHAVNMMDYTETIGWIVVVGVGASLFLIGSAIIGNPVNILLRTCFQKARLPATKKMLGQAIDVETDIYIKWFWILFSLSFLVILARVLMVALPQFEMMRIDVPEFSAMFLDSYFRVFLFIMLPILAFCMFFVGLLIVLNLLSDLDAWILSRKGRMQKPAFRIARFKRFLKEMVSKVAFGCYLIGIGIFALGVVFGSGAFLLYLAGAIVLGIPIGRGMFKSFCSTCRDFKLTWTSELRYDMVYGVNQIVLFIWLLGPAILLMKTFALWTMEVCRVMIIDSLKHPLAVEWSRENIETVSEKIGPLNFVLSQFFVIAILFLGFVLASTYYLLPIIHRRTNRKKKLKRLLFPSLIAILSFVTGESIAWFMSPEATSNVAVALSIPIASFASAYLTEVAYEEAMKLESKKHARARGTRNLTEVTAITPSPSKDVHICKRCGYILPKKDAVVSGWDAEGSSTHVHCPRCGKIIARYIR